MKEKEEKKQSVPKRRFPGFTEPWEQRRLGEFFIQTNETVNPYVSDIPLWSLTVESGLIPKSERYDRSFITKKEDQYKIVNPREIVFNPMNMTIGAIGINRNPFPIAVSGYYVTLKEAYSNDKEIESYFFSEWMNSPNALKLYKNAATGSLVEKQRVQFSTFSKIVAALPKYEEQKKIGQVFNIVDHLITLHQRKLDDLKLLKKGLLQKMFPKNGENIPEIRFPGFTDDWEQRRLEDYGKKFYGGGTPSTKENKLWDGSLPWIQSSDLTDGCLFGLQPRKFITEEAIAQSATKKIPANSIAIVTRVGVGKLAYIPFMYSTSQDFLSIADLTVDPYFGVYSIYTKLNKNKQVQGTAIKGITSSEIKNLNMYVPGMNEQRKIGSLFQQLDNLITLHQRKLDDLKLLKKGLLQEMFV